MHAQIVTAQRTSSHEVQGPQCAKDPSTAHHNHVVGRELGASLCGSHATRNATTGVRAGREVIIVWVFVLVERRKRRDSNPRYLSVRSLSRPRGTVCWSVSQAAYLRASC
jgi:hypothetical protein